MKKLFASSLVALSLASSLFAGEKITIGASQVPHSEILEFVKPILEKEGYDLDVKVFFDYVIPNLAVNDGELDGNYFQHIPYLNEFNKNKGTKIAKVTAVHIEPMGVYSKKIKDIKDLPNNAKVSLPNDPTNESRALNILAKAGLIELSPNELNTPLDITKNPKNLKFIEIEAASTPRTLDDVDIALINTNYALSVGLNPVNDALVIESKDSPYVNVLAVKEGNEDKDKIKALAKALNSQEVKEFIQEKFKGAVVPAF